MADTPGNNPVIREILRQGRKLQKSVRGRYTAAALETGRIESNFQNLPGGDADSVNWRQERASIYGGDMSIRRSVARFYKEAAEHDRGQPSFELAADVQRPAEQYRGRYRTAQQEALTLLGSSYGSRGGAGPTSVSTSRPSMASTVTTTTPGVDNSATRRQLVGDYLSQGGVANSAATTTLAGAYSHAQDVPGVTTATTTENPAGGTPKKAKARESSAGPIGGELLEMFYNGAGGVNVDQGKRVGRGFVGGHEDHVHVAAGPKTVVSLGHIAQGMGLTVRENPAFDKVDPVHVEGSYHYRKQAIDVSGDPKKMAEFSRRVAKLMGV